MFERWRDAMEQRGLKINLGKTKLLVTGKRNLKTPVSVRFPCSVCSAGVGVNSILCKQCGKWCHKRRSGVENLNRVQQFVCPRCDGTWVDLQREDDTILLDNGRIEEVSQFCCLGDVIDREGGAERAAAAARMAIASWLNWRELSSLLCNSGVSQKHRVEVYHACVQSTMLHGSETWSTTVKVETMLLTCERRMLRRMCGLTLRDRVPSDNILRWCRLDDLTLMMKRRRMLWFGHVCRREAEDPLSRIRNFEAPGRRPRGRPKKTWRECVQNCLDEMGISETDTANRAQWRSIIRRLTS